MSQQLWATTSLGGYLTNNRLSKIMREQMGPEFVFRQFAQVKEGGKNQGDIVYFDKMLRIDTKGGTVAETATVPNNLIKFLKGSVQVTEYANAISYTDKLDTLAEWDVNNKFQQGLVLDYKDTLDSACAALFTSADFVAVCTSTASTVFTTNGTATATAAVSFSEKNLKDVVDYLKQKHTPYYGGGNYIGILSNDSMRGVYDGLEQMMAYTTPVLQFNFERGKYYNCRTVEDNNYLSNAKGSGSVFGEAVIFGSEAIIEAVAQVEEIRADIPTDLGRSKKVGWYFIGAWAKMWDLSSDNANSTGKGIERIVWVTSV